MPDGHKYEYRDDTPLEFTSVDIAYNFDSIDVDTGIPNPGIVNDNTFAVIIANESYSIIENTKSQTPTVIPSGAMSAAWKDLRLR